MPGHRTVVAMGLGGRVHWEARSRQARGGGVSESVGLGMQIEYANTWKEIKQST